MRIHWKRETPLTVNDATLEPAGWRDRARPIRPGEFHFHPAFTQYVIPNGCTPLLSIGPEPHFTLNGSFVKQSLVDEPVVRVIMDGNHIDISHHWIAQGSRLANIVSEQWYTGDVEELPKQYLMYYFAYRKYAEYKSGTAQQAA